MSYRIDPSDNSIIFEGHENGIADNPYNGIADMRNVNIISVPGEASVGFSTTAITYSSPGSGNVTSADAPTDVITYSSLPSIEAGMAVTFSVTTIAGISTGVVYWLGNTSSTQSKLYSDYTLNTVVNLTSGGTGTFSVVTISGYPKYFTQDSNGSYYTIDSTGRVWSNVFTTTNGFWRYLGNTTLTNASGNGIVAYSASDGTVYVFIFRNSLIDYLKSPAGSTPSWVYGWNPTTAGSGSVGTMLKTSAGTNNNHEAIVGPDNKVYFVDANWIGRFYQIDPATAFDPTNTATYVYDQTSLLPFTDIANCLAPLGTNLLVGGSKNVVYPWDTFSPLPSYPLMIAVINIKKMITVNTNTFIFAGNRGRIYITNGSQAQLYKKIPDHISGTVEPYFTWGGATSNKNQLYFSASVTTNAGSAISQYGGVWAIDLDTQAIRLVNKLSYATYAGYATALIPNTFASAAGTGIYIGWDSGSSTYGIDTTSSSPYTGSQAVIVYDLVPIGTFDNPSEFERVEYKLTKPMVSGESISIYARLIFNTTDTGFGTAMLTDSTVGNFSSSAPVNFKNAQWLQLQAVLNSTASSPSYTRLKEIRIKRVTKNE